MAQVTITMTEDQQQILMNILSSVYNGRKLQRGMTVCQSTIYDLDQNDAEAMTFFTDKLNWKQSATDADVIQRLDKIQTLTLITAKEALNVDEVSLLTGLKKQTIYNLIHDRKIPCYKPEGHTVRFRKSEINDWLLQNRQRTNAEIDAQASLHTVFNHSTF